ncbi:MAG: hypothetical protein ACC707_02820 [Thiohalomonadales bacterium]
MNTPTNNCNGYALITSLIFLTTLTLIAVVSTQDSSIGYKMATNGALKERAFQSSEAARQNVGDVVNEFVYESGWTPTVVNLLPSGVTIVDDTLSLNDNLAGENFAFPNTLVPDLTYQVDANADSDFVDGGDINANIVVFRTQQGLAPGSSVAMLSAANGVGKGVNSSIRIYYEIRSRGLMASGARSNTATELRIVPN